VGDDADDGDGADGADVVGTLICTVHRVFMSLSERCSKRKQ
jgi:hypothetical protein